MLVQFGNNWIQTNSSGCQIGLGLWPRPIWQSSEFFSSNYFQIGQHVVLLHILIVEQSRCHAHESHLLLSSLSSSTSRDFITLTSLCASDARLDSSGIQMYPPLYSVLAIALMCVALSFPLRSPN